MITRTGTALTGVVRKMLARRMDLEEERVGLCRPGENAGFQVCIYLYDIRKNMDLFSGRMTAVSTTELRYPSAYYDLYYVIVPWMDSDLKYREEEETKLLDVLIQSLADVCVLDIGEEIPLELNDLDFDDRLRLWAGLGQPLRTAVYVKAGPVEIRSMRTRQVSRVKDVRMEVSPYGLTPEGQKKR